MLPGMHKQSHLTVLLKAELDLDRSFEHLAILSANLNVLIGGLYHIFRIAGSSAATPTLNFVFSNLKHRVLHRLDCP